MHWLTSVPGCSKQRASGIVMFDLVKQICQQLGIGGLPGVPVPDGGNGGCPPVPVKTGTGGWPEMGADEVGATGIEDELEEDELDVDEDSDEDSDDVEGVGGLMYPLPVGKGLWPPQKLCNQEVYSVISSACPLSRAPLECHTCRSLGFAGSLARNCYTLINIPRDLGRAEHLRRA